MARLNARWFNFSKRGQTWDHYWQDAAVSGAVRPTLDFVCGWECRIISKGSVSTPDQYHWDNTAPSAAISISTATVRSGTASLHFSTTGTADSVQKVIARNIVTGRVYARFVTFAATTFIRHINANGNIDIIMDGSGNVTAKAGSGSTTATIATLSANTWYRLDWVADSSVNPATIKVKVDGGTEVTATSASQVAANMTEVHFGPKSNVTMEGFLDDLWLGTVAGDYPLGAGTVERMKPTRDGTHSFTAGDFSYDVAGGAVATSATDVWGHLDDDDLTSTADLIRQTVVNSVGYVQVGFGSAPFTRDALGIMVVAAFHADGTNANTFGMVVNDGGTLRQSLDDAGDDLMDVSQVTLQYAEDMMLTPPSGGTWTQAKIEALLIRGGYSTDILAVPYWDNVMLELAYAASGGASISRTATESLTFGDVATRTGIFVRTNSDAFTLADVATRVATLFRTVTQTITFADVPTRSVTMNRTGTDAITLADTASRVLTLARTSSDAVTLADVATRSSILARTTTDSITLADVATALRNLLRNVTDAITLGDVATRNGVFGRTVSQTITLADVATRSVILVRTGADGITLSDVAVWSKTVLRTVTDAIGLSDVATRLFSGFRTSSDSITLADVATRTNTVTRTVSQTITLADVATRTSTAVRTVSQTITLADVATRTGIFNRSMSQSLTLGDVATASKILLRTTTDALHLADVATAGKTLLRAVSDALNLSDVATRSGNFLRSASDALHLSDSALASIVGVVIDGVRRAIARIRGGPDSSSNELGGPGTR